MTGRIPVVKVIVQNEDGKLLIAREEESRKWELAGGIIRKDEDRFEAAEREIKEETGLKISGLRDLVRLELEDDRLIDCYLMYAEDYSGQIEPREDISETRWIDKSELKDVDWHIDSSYNLVPLLYLQEYLEDENDYSEGEEIEVVKILIQNKEGRFLALQKTTEEKVHSGHKYTLYGRMAGKWELPGGKFKESSDRFQAAIREVKEECGIEISSLRDVVREEIEEKHSVNVYILFTDDWDGQIELSREHQNYRWVTPEEYKNMNWHQDAGYGYPPMNYLENYLRKDKNY